MYISWHYVRFTKVQESNGRHRFGMRTFNSCVRQPFWNECVCNNAKYWTIPLGRDWMQVGLSCLLKELNCLASYFYTSLRPWKSIQAECYLSKIRSDKNVWLRDYSTGIYRAAIYVYYGNITASWRIPWSPFKVLSSNADISLERRKVFT
jgi:hypothetical protein